MYLDSSRVFLLFTTAFYLFHVFFVDRDVSRNFFVTVIVAIFIYLTYEKKQKAGKVEEGRRTFFTTLEKDIAGTSYIFHKIYPLHKPSKSLQYIKKDPMISNVVYTLRKLRIYDDASFLMIVILLEYFLKVHFNVMTGHYDPGLFAQILNDTASEITSTLMAITLNVPRVSTVVEIPGGDFEEHVSKQALHLKSILNIYIKALRNKHQWKVDHADPYDVTKDPSFYLF